MSLLRPTLAALVLLTAAACDDGGGPQAGTTRVQITDAPFPYGHVARADVHIVSVTASSGSDLPQVLATPGRSYNLMELQGGRTADLGTAVLTPGLYDRVDVTIDLGRSSLTLVDGTILTASSAPGLRFAGSATSNQVTVTARLDRPIDATGNDARLVIDFDLASSFRPMNLLSPASGFMVSPQVTAFDASETGSIEGTAASDQGPLPDATISLVASDGRIVTTTRTNAAGRFHFGFVYPGSYELLIEAPLTSDFGSTTRSGVTVSAAGSPATAGTVTVPRATTPSLPGTYVLRKAGANGTMQGLPIQTWFANTKIFLDADTLILEPSGAGLEIEVNRHIPVGGEPVTIRVERWPVSYTQSGRAITLRYQCSISNCMSFTGMLVGSTLVVVWPGSTVIGGAWPREYERVAP